MTWQTEEFEGEHEGRAAAVLADGSEPKPMIYDVGSGSEFHRTSDWWVYDGTLGAPEAAALRAACSCGWRGAPLHPLDWEQVRADDPEEYDTSGPEEEWDRHVTEVEARTVPLPAELAGLLRELDRQLENLADDAPLAALRAAGALERTTSRTARTAAFNIRNDEIPDAEIATGLGLSEATAGSRVLRYYYAR
ncbi:hypothetical protein OOK31_16580 [Streptomyces sp. NBC_00249]|uniref:hypothetical protein n=1 Tax=Streptomyces sp. NBC_00249 TaxID=2975690 RepID=UPI002251B491|nr:hypothetical protein [Streptomyces sp. NBC_00249]MCX5195501.1 hypothetical protein [Streptomyces sp. NBC_00249]